MKSRRSLTFPLLVAAASALSLVGGPPGVAHACGGEWYPEVQIDPRIRGVDRAEDALDDGHVLAAAGSVVRMIPHIRTLSPTKTKLIQRAHRVLAIATARYGGALPIGREVPTYAQGAWLGKTESDRKANLEWAANALREVAKARNDDPAARTELAEALAALDATRDEARRILEELAAKDLITSADGYAALATLRDAAGDLEGRRVAVERCRSMARPGGQCDPRATVGA